MVIRSTKLLIVDDSALMRKMLRELFGSSGRFERRPRATAPTRSTRSSGSIRTL